MPTRVPRMAPNVRRTAKSESVSLPSPSSVGQEQLQAAPWLSIALDSLPAAVSVDERVVVAVRDVKEAVALVERESVEVVELELEVLVDAFAYSKIAGYSRELTWPLAIARSLWRPQNPQVLEAESGGLNKFVHEAVWVHVVVVDAVVLVVLVFVLDVVVDVVLVLVTLFLVWEVDL